MSTYTIDILSDAEEDLEYIFKWYEKQKEGLGSTFKDKVEQIIDRLKMNPFIYQVRYRNTRISFLEKFPYGIHFRIVGTVVQIIAVLAEKQDPKLWNE